MAGGAPRGPSSPASETPDRTRIVLSSVSLLLLVLGAAGRLSDVRVASAIGLFLFALVGFGSAILIRLGYRGMNLLSLSSPLGLALLLITGALLSTTGIWAIGPVLYWLVAAAAAGVHLSVLVQARRLRRRGPLGAPGRPWLSRRVEEFPPPLEVLARERPRPLVLVSSVVMAGALVVCVSSALAIANLDPGWGGLLAAISPAWYVGLVALVFAIIAGQRLGGVFAGLPVLLLQFVLTSTPAIVYSAPKYPWTIKQVGEASFILLHGLANPKIDIYQAWPGLFSATAWLCRVAGLSNPLQIARWWSPIIDAATTLVVYQLASRVLRSPRRAWIAAAIFVVGYTISDSDYFSSQSTSFLLAVAIFATVFRHDDEDLPMSTPAWLLLLAAALAEAVTHQLTPYMATSALVILVLLRRSRTKWAPVITLAPAVAWAYAHYAYVAQHVSFSELFNIFSNVTTPGLSQGGPAPGTAANIVRYFQGGSALLIGFLALAALLRYRTRLHFILALCAASAGSLLAANSYGNEAAFRVVLFALPWLAIMGATWRPRSPKVATLWWSAVLVVLLPVYLVADMGLDFVYAGRATDLSAMQAFELHAPLGSTLIIIGNSSGDPINLTGRFSQVNEISYPEVLGYNKAGARSPAVSFSQFMVRLQTTVQSVSPLVVGPNPAYYVLFARQPASYMAAYNYATLHQYGVFRQQFVSSPLWAKVLTTPTAELFKLRAWPKFHA